MIGTDLLSTETIPRDRQALEGFLQQLMSDFPRLDLHEYVAQQLHSFREEDSVDRIADRMILDALERVSGEEPDWTFVASRIYLLRLYGEASRHPFRQGKPYGDFYELIRGLTESGVYSPLLLEAYTRAEIGELAMMIRPERDHLFTYAGLRTLADRYLARSREGELYELPQERFLVIAMVLMSREERERRLHWVREAYWALSNLYMTVATPTLSNAGKDFGQLSSCFVDVVDDSLQGIYDSNTDVARVSKGEAVWVSTWAKSGPGGVISRDTKGSAPG